MSLALFERWSFARAGALSVALSSSLGAGCLGPIEVTEPAPDVEGNGDAGIPSGSNQLPTTGIHFDADVPAGEASTALAAVSDLQLSEPQQVEFPYDPREPNAESPEPATLEVRQACVTRTYDLAANPTQVLLHGVEGATSWPGALLEGGAYSSGSLRMLNLRAEDRAPITLVLNDNAGGSSSRTIESPTASAVEDAMLDIIIRDYGGDLPLGVGVASTYRETKDVSRFLLEAGISTRLGAYRDELSASIDPKSSHRTVVVHLVQKLFDVEVEPPPAPEAWFEPSFFEGGLAEKRELGEISEANPPIYAGRLTYGRMLMFTLTSTASSSDLSALLRASASTLLGGALQLDAKLSQVQQNAAVSVFPIGGDAIAAQAAVRSGDWGAFFRDDLRLNAVPITMELKNLADDTPAGISEVGPHDEPACTTRLVVPGPFDFALEEAHARPNEVGDIQHVLTGDFDGDGATDLFWNSLVQNDNTSYVGFGSLEGRLRVDAAACGGQACNFSNTQIPWVQYRPVSGDFNGDGRSDLAWVPAREWLSSLGYELHVLLANEAGFASGLVRQALPQATSEFVGVQEQVLVRDMNQDGADDLVFWFVERVGTETVQDFQILRATPASFSGSPFALDPRQEGVVDTDLDYPNTPLHFDVQDVNGDGRHDLVWGLSGLQPSAAGSPQQVNRTRWRLNEREPNDAAITWSGAGSFDHGSAGGWASYRTVYGDFDGDGDSDAAWVRYLQGSQGAVHQAPFDGAGFTLGVPVQWWSAQVANPLASLLEQHHILRTIDVGGDAALDVVANAFVVQAGLPVANSIAVMKGVEQGSPLFDVGLGQQVHPINQDWPSYEHTLIGDFNGDGQQDLLWNDPWLDNSVFMGFATPADIE